MASLHVSFAVLSFALLSYVCRAQDCNTLFTFNGSVVNFTKCSALAKQNAALAWTYYENNSTLLVGFAGTAPSSSGWVGWGINPTAKGRMVGTSALIAFSASNGSNVLPYKLTEAVYELTEPLTCSPVDLVVDATAVEIQETTMSIFAALQLPSNMTSLNFVWNRGPGVQNFQPAQHGLTGEDLSGFETFNISTAQSLGGGEPPHQTLKRTHGIINTIAWGILLPLGVIAARYLRPFTESLWFYIHVPLQTVGYLLGVLGWALGMRLRAVTAAAHKSHENIGIALFVLATLQLFSLFLRPNKDHKLRRYWNYYHHSIGYTIILLSIINIFKGLDILSPGGKWKSGYVASLIVMAVIAVVLEVVTWFLYIKRRRDEGLP
ncbi:hypothetical protein L7F22_058751 [Adiantum nelumboides]|nr:hypothetical protein [Adiantum nelumboides]